MEELNRSLFLAINASAEASLPMRELAIFFAQWMVFCVPLLLAVLWIFGEQRQRRVVLLAGVSIALALACNLVIRELWFHPRPFMLGLGQNFLAHAPGASFPSDHASGLFAMAFALILASLRKTGLVMLGPGTAGKLGTGLPGCAFPPRHPRRLPGGAAQCLAGTPGAGLAAIGPAVTGAAGRGLPALARRGPSQRLIRGAGSMPVAAADMGVLGLAGRDRTTDLQALQNPALIQVRPFATALAQVQ